MPTSQIQYVVHTANRHQLSDLEIISSVQFEKQINCVKPEAEQQSVTSQNILWV